MKIAITGGAGFIGKHITKAYLDAGHDVIVIDNLACNMQQHIDTRARFYRLDIRDTHLSTILQQERPDIVSYHVAQPHTIVPCTQLLAEADVHVHGLLNVLQGCVNASVKKVIFASSGNSLYGHPARLPVTEETSLAPQSAYDISKVAGEWYVRYYTRNYGLQHIILRYADVYAANIGVHEQAAHLLHYFAHMFAQQRSPIIRGTGEQRRDHIFIDDIVRANLQALTLGNNQTFNISSGQGYSPNQLFQLTAHLLQSSIEPTYISGPLDEEYAIVLDNTLAQRLLKWRPEVSLESGIRRLIKQAGRAVEPFPEETLAPPHEESSIERRVLTEV